MLVASINYSLSLGYALSFLLTGLFAATLLHTYRNLAGLTLTRINAGTAFCGENLVFTLQLHNASKLDRVGVRVISKVGESITDIANNHDASLDLSVPTETRGPLALGRLTLRSDYPLGLWTTWSYVHANAAGMVFPRAEINPPPLPADSRDAEGIAPRRGSQGDVAGLRDYQVGDPLTAVAWKTAARGQGLFVRTFDEELGGNNTHLTLASTAEIALEAQLSRLTAWVLQAEAVQVDYAVELPDQALASNRGAEHQLAALTALAVYRQAA